MSDDEVVIFPYTLPACSCRWGGVGEARTYVLQLAPLNDPSNEQSKRFSGFPKLRQVIRKNSQEFDESFGLVPGANEGATRPSI